MIVVRGLPRRLPRPTALALGTFDAVHRGHARILRAVVAAARAVRAEPVAVTFENHPMSLLVPARAPALLTSLDTRLRLVAASGIRRAVVVPFTQGLASVRAEAFVREILVRRLHARAVVAGPGLHFGNRREGDLAMLRRLGRDLGLSVRTVPPLLVSGRPASSTRIRESVAANRFGEAERCLGRAYVLEGTIVSGAGRGARLGSPTVNLDPGLLHRPRDGVYAGWLVLGARRWPSVANLGRRPTFERHGAVRLEAFVLAPAFARVSPARVRPGRAVSFEFARFLRPERKFSDAASLARQIRRDVAAARRQIRTR